MKISQKILKPLKLASKICLEIFTFLFGVMMVGGTILLENIDAVNTVLKGETQTTIEDPDAASKDSEYFKTAFNSVSEVKKNGEIYAETIVAEGATLLKNDGALPLAKDAKVSLFSTSSVDPIVTGTGSGGSSGSIISLKEGLEEAGLQVNSELWDWYKENLGTYGKQKSGGTVGTMWTIGDAPWNQIPTAAKTQKVDAAVFVLSRSGGEGIDSTIYGGDKSDFGDGNYLKLSPTERDVLKNLKALKGTAFDHIIVLLNFANQVQLDFVEEYGVDALLWVGNYGEVGAYAIGDLLAGNVNPSGRLADTFWREHWLNPVHANFATLIDTTNNASQWNMSTNSKSVRSIVYQEGVYMGYRYTETRYEDKILGAEKTGDFDYSAAVAYPFGYGISYTDFTYSDFKASRVSASGKTEAYYDVSVKVTNTGSMAGKEVVQVYAQKPYTEYDKQYGIEKPAVELVGFAKTKTIKPGDSETVNITVNERELATYDAYNAKTYIMEDGRYYLTVAKDAHAAVNNVLAAKEKTTEDGMTAAGSKNMVYSELKQYNDELYSHSAVNTDVKITNQFDDVDLKLYEGSADKERLVYMSRSNWEGTVFYGLDAQNNRTNTFFNVTNTDKMQKDFTDNWNPVVEGNTSHGGEYPTYGSTKTGYVLADMRAFEDGTPIPYDNPLWDDLLDQLTFEDTVKLLSCGFRKTAALSSISKPETIDHNGGSGPVMSYNVGEGEGVNRGYAVRTEDPDKTKKPVIYPCNALIASTYNLELADYYGRQWGEDCLWSGLSGLYGMGINTHRSAYGGRNFEYYSEDPVLMGKIAAQTTKGMATRGAYVYLKHCFLNDQETARCGGFTWANEQSIREIYLKSFQIAIEEGGAQCVMGGLNSLGVKWTGTHGFMNTVLRDEFGMSGHVVTDSYGCYNGSYVRGVLYGNDIPDGTLNESKENFDYVKDGKHADMAWAMRDAAHRVLYTVVQSNAMNGITNGTRIITYLPAWVYTVKGFMIATGVLFGLSLAAFAVSMGFTYQEQITGLYNKLLKKENKVEGGKE
ncbi:MAG: glycoside hydrolase family 3 C-terminal domain-containing protein [Clostridia bacterium]|nr:glycoside hydrolase family 3 C-terminal domain-containing protein [Clostridia bacterium]